MHTSSNRGWIGRHVRLVGLLFVLVACGAAFLVRSLLAERTDTADELRLIGLSARLSPLHKRLGPPKPGEWLASHPEDGQTFRDYVRSRPVTPNGKRRAIYIQPLGEFTDKQRQVVTLTADFMGRTFNRPIVVQPDLPANVVPDSARRQHPTWRVHQILSTYVLDDVLKPRLPDDAAALIAFTAADLWPGEDWNFVFGQASLSDRVGVWWLARFGNPEAGDAAFRLCLLRTLKTATHETGHMFSIQHCTAYDCNMCGSNHLQEGDAKPLYFCPECVAKIWWATGADPADRYRGLAEFCNAAGLTNETAYYNHAANLVDGRQ